MANKLITIRFLIPKIISLASVPAAAVQLQVFDFHSKTKGYTKLQTDKTAQYMTVQYNAMGSKQSTYMHWL